MFTTNSLKAAVDALETLHKEMIVPMREEVTTIEKDYAKTAFVNNVTRGFYYADLTAGETLPQADSENPPVDGSFAIVKVRETVYNEYTREEDGTNTSDKLYPYIKVNVSNFFTAADAETIDEGTIILGTSSSGKEFKITLTKTDSDTWTVGVVVIDGANTLLSGTATLSRGSDADYVEIKFSGDYNQPLYEEGGTNYGFPSGIFLFKVRVVTIEVRDHWWLYYDYQWQDFGLVSMSLHFISETVDSISELRQNVMSLISRIGAVEEALEDNNNTEEEQNNNDN